MLGLVYARTSHENDDAYSVSSQVDSCLEYAKRNGIQVPDEYVFREDYSGKEFDRPEYSKVRELIKSQAVQSVIVYATDRLARKVSVGEIFFDEMCENKVSLHIHAWSQAVRNTPEDRLRFNFESTFSGFEREKIMERTMRGKVKKASMGKVVTHARPLFGYSVNEYNDNFVLNEYAPIVREVLTSYGIDHTSACKIADSLHARGIKTPGSIKADELEVLAELKLKSGRITEEQYDKFLKNAEHYRSRWTNQTVYNILINARSYSGDFKFSLKGVEYRVAIPAIVEPYVADAVENALAIGKKRNDRTGKNLYLMARRLSCECGYSYGVAPKKNKSFTHYYRCTSHRNRYVSDCTNRPIRNTLLDPKVKDFIRELLLNPENLFTWWQEQNKRNESDNERTQEQIVSVEERIVELKAKLYRTLDRLTDKLDADETVFYTQQRDSIKKLLAEYQEDLEKLERSLVVSKVNPEIIQSFAEMGKEYREVLTTSDDFSFWRGLVDDLDITGIVGNDEKGQYIELILMDDIRRKEYVGTDLANSSINAICYHFRYHLPRIAL